MLKSALYGNLTCRGNSLSSFFIGALQVDLLMVGSMNTVLPSN